MGGTDDPDGYYGAFDRDRPAKGRSTLMQGPEPFPAEPATETIDTTPIEAGVCGYELQRSDEMRRGAEAQCERYRKELLELKRASPTGNFLDVLVFIESLKHTNGHVDRALFMTRGILSEVDAAGGIRGDGDTT